uniref:Cytochrome P450 n=1 Tax=Parastrongyloides trichosuri TaxID=131310 RepID=A0A0N4ZM43_PARTI
MLLIIITTIIALLVIYFYKNVYSFPPGPFPLPLIGNLYSIDIKKLHIWVKEQKEKYGSVFTIHIPIPFVVLGDVDAIKEAYIDNGDNFLGRETRQIFEKFFNIKENTGVVLSEGDWWKNQRRLSLTILHNFGMGRSIIEERIKMSIDDLFEHLDSLKDKEHIDLSKSLHLTVGNVINGILYGFIYKHDNAEKFYEFTSLFEQMIKGTRTWKMRIAILFPDINKIPILNKFISKPLMEIQRKIFEIHHTNIEKCKKTYNPNNEPPNFVHAVLKELESNESKYSNLENDHLEGMVRDFYTAGMETITVTLKFFFLYLLNDINLQEKLRSEIYDVVGKDNEIHLSHRNELIHVESFIYESQRKSSILGFPLIRKCTKDTYIKNNLIKKGSLILPYDYIANHDEKYFKDPYVFKADRFINEDGETLNKNLIDKFVPFGAGKRICAGKSLAEAELFLILTHLLQRYRFIPNGPIDMEIQFGNLLTPKPYTCKIEKIL